MSSNTHINNKWKSDPCKCAEKAARLCDKRVAKRNQAKEEKVRATNDDVLSTEDAFDPVAADDTAPSTGSIEDTEALATEVEEAAAEDAFDAVAADNAAPPKMLNEDADPHTPHAHIHYWKPHNTIVSTPNPQSLIWAIGVGI